MGSLRQLVSLALVALALVGAFGAGCGTEPVGQDSCRKIEQARCEVASRCSDLKVGSVDSCKRFYRDQCLHGLPLEADPGAPKVDKCVLAIQAAGACPQGQACVATTRPVADACEVIKAPEVAVDCAFLVPPAAPTTATTATTDAGSDAPADGMM